MGLEACAVDGRDDVKSKLSFWDFFKFVVVVWFILGGF